MQDAEHIANLVHAAVDGERQAWDELVERLTPMLWSVARAHRLERGVAADVVQTTWLRAVEHIHRIERPERFPGWLATTARRESLRALRHAARAAPTEDGRLPEPVVESDPAGRLVTEERDRTLWAAFERLPDHCRRLLRVLMAPGDAPSYHEVSAALDMPVGSIGPTRQRCLERLRRELEMRGITPASCGSTW